MAMDIAVILDEAFSGQERVTRDELYRRAVAADAPADVRSALGSLPEGEYALDEVADALDVSTTAPGGVSSVNALREGVSAMDLDDEDLLRELKELHRTRNDTLRHGSAQALECHNERQAELEGEYLRRFPEREVAPDRLRSGARARS
jgi:hypothetical protein